MAKKNESNQEARSSAMETFGEGIIGDLQEFADVLDKGEKVSEKFTFHKMVLNLEPTPYDPELVKTTRAILNASQSVFAKFLGVSVKTVQAWEQGENSVNGAACRLMDEIRENPEYWQLRLVSLAEKKDSDCILQ